MKKEKPPFTIEMFFQSVRESIESLTDDTAVRYDVSVFYVNDIDEECVEHFYGLTLFQERQLLVDCVSYNLNVFQIKRSKSNLNE